MIISRTVQELAIAEDNGLALWATPSGSGNLGTPYWASAANWQDDVCIATVNDFLKYEGYDSLCRDDDYMELNESYECEINV